MSDLGQRLQRVGRTIEQTFLGKSEAVRLMLIATIAGEHMVLVGPPGTAKSALVRLMSKLISARYFEYLLTRFSEPNEIFGPIDIQAFQLGSYKRRTEGMLPEAEIVFLDEVFKANSAILNALLTLLNEREFDNGTRREPTPLISVIGATNEVPDDEVTAAFYDRFLLRLRVEPVTQAGFDALLRLPFSGSLDVPDALRLGGDELASIASGLDAVSLPEEVAVWLRELRAHLASRGVTVSDRRWHKIVRLLKTSAITNARTAVEIWDLWLLRYCAAGKPEEEALVAEWYERRLGVFEALDPERFARVVQAFEAQLELERNASGLDYGEDGRLRLGESVGDAKGASFATRMTSIGVKRYGPTHIAARCAQMRGLIAEIDDYLKRLDAMRGRLRAAVAAQLWIEPGFGSRADANLARTGEAVAGLRERALAALEGYASLPRLPSDSGAVPEPIAT